MSENVLAEAATRVARVLETLDAKQRQLVLRTALALLGDAHHGTAPSVNHSADLEASTLGTATGPLDIVLRRLGLTIAQIENYLHFENGVAIPIALPGGAQSKREQTMNTYLLAGLAAALSQADAKFSDADARSLCNQFGCYDAPNHVRIVKALGNKLTGSKESGWKLTSPGLAAAASLIKSGV